jgi:hypothetical protein
MLEYDAQFSDGGVITWLPYVMYFHPADYRSPVVNTDSLGFRFTTCDGETIGVDDYGANSAVNILAGSSTVFGIGASCDAATMASRLNHHSAGQSAPWINMGGRSHNSAQELLLHVLTRHRLPKIDRIVLFSGFNDLGLARLAAASRFEGGAFFLCNTFFDRLEERHRGAGRLRRRLRSVCSGGERPAGAAEALDLDQQIRYAAGLVLRHLDAWRALAEDAGAQLTYVLQPLARWVRDVGTEKEEALFSYLDELGRFSDRYGDIGRPDVGRRYADLLRAGCERMGVGFADMTPLVAGALEPTDWMFVDRIHFTDYGYDLVARLLLDEILAVSVACLR